MTGLIHGLRPPGVARLHQYRFSSSRAIEHPSCAEIDTLLSDPDNFSHGCFYARPADEDARFTSLSRRSSMIPEDPTLGILDIHLSSAPAAPTQRLPKPQGGRGPHEPNSRLLPEQRERRDCALGPHALALEGVPLPPIPLPRHQRLYEGRAYQDQADEARLLRIPESLGLHREEDTGLPTSRPFHPLLRKAILFLIEPPQP